jgi:hypothetical protein
MDRPDQPMLVRLLSTQQADFSRQFRAIRERGADTGATVEAQARRIAPSSRVRAALTG